MANFVVLLVEDDKLQREILADLLKNEGFEVIECTTAEAAELIIATTGTELRAIVTDHNLAGEMTGAALARYARCRQPGMTIVVMSGTTVKPLPANATFLQKPFAPERLLEVVRD
jgi:DNA-binding NtrC family response regulator